LPPRRFDPLFTNEGICQAPERWTILEQDVRRRLTRVFPYATLYVIEEGHLLVVAVMHLHRKTEDRLLAHPDGGEPNWLEKMAWRATYFHFQ
jgi:hypothetical protein